MIPINSHSSQEKPMRRKRIEPAMFRVTKISTLAEDETFTALLNGVEQSSHEFGWGAEDLNLPLARRARYTEAAERAYDKSIAALHGYIEAHIAMQILQAIAYDVDLPGPLPEGVQARISLGGGIMRAEWPAGPVQ
jgi:hypothetical protein